MKLKIPPINSFVIVGGGTAGWITAAILSKVLCNTEARVVLVESPDISTIGVGEATVPSFVDMLKFLGISEKDFISANNATFKLGIKFTNWQSKGNSYWHPFGAVGAKIDGCEFFQHWLKAYFHGDTSRYTDFSPAAAIGDAGKFYIPDPDKPNNLYTMGYALHFDAGRAAEYLATYAQSKGVTRISAHVENATLDENGFIRAISLRNGAEIKGEFFIDCSGQKAMLIDDALGVQYENWSHYLPVNRAAVVQTGNIGSLRPYTEAIAHAHGWRWKIPLQNRAGNGYVYCGDYCSSQAAIDLLMTSVEGELLTEPRTISFTTGKRKKMWEKNCVAIGLSSGFLEPLESTSIYLIMRAALNFVSMLPNKALAIETQSEYNRLMDIEYSCLRDFIVLHYSLSERSDSEFWRSWRTRPIPDSLHKKIELYKSQGRLLRNDMDLFASNSWYAVLSGMGLFPEGYDPLVDVSDFKKTKLFFRHSQESLKHSVSQLLSHEEYLRRVIKN